MSILRFAAKLSEPRGPSMSKRALPPWEDAVRAIAAADVGLISQSRRAGDETAVTTKVYEYLALGKPVLCLSDGGATEALLQRLGAGEFSAHALATRLRSPQRWSAWRLARCLPLLPPSNSLPTTGAVERAARQKPSTA